MFWWQRCMPSSPDHRSSYKSRAPILAVLARAPSAPPRCGWCAQGVGLAGSVARGSARVLYLLASCVSANAQGRIDTYRSKAEAAGAKAALRSAVVFEFNAKSCCSIHSLWSFKPSRL